MKAVESLRTLLILGRVSNLPSVWSNLLVGWFVVGGQVNVVDLLLLLAGGSFLYVAGMYLNDFCDVTFDAEFCKSRPIPSGKISRKSVGIFALVWFVLGIACLAYFGGLTAGIAFLLAASIVLYNCRHKGILWAPIVMGLCRFLLYPLAASAAGFIPVSLFPIAVALGIYVAGITYVARGESRPGKPVRWPQLLLVIPVGVAFESTGFVSYPVLLASIVQLSWTVWLLPLSRKKKRSVGQVVSGLLAGIVLVDIVALSTFNGYSAFYLISLFVLALLLQRVIPAT